MGGARECEARSAPQGFNEQGGKTARPCARAQKEYNVNHTYSSGPDRPAGPRSGRLKRILALAGIILLAALYLVTFFLAVLGDARSIQLLRFCFGMTIFLPIFLWVLIWCVGYLRHKRSMASLDILDSNPEERARMEEAVSREIERSRDPG